ncbi:MAG: LD-carboxypeptidase [Bacteroidales bacterium]|nr:MAG: LD-carboxypeptidase [Bacteroidales bacterium]
MITPPFLKTNDIIGIVAPAGRITEKKITRAVEILGGWGLKVELGRNIFKRKNTFAGNDKQRKDDFQDVIDREDIKAVICARGGYGTLRIINKIDFKKFRQNPKWIVGFSDITVIHSYLQHKVKCESIHSVMPGNFPENDIESKSLNSLKNVLFGGKTEYSINSHSLNRAGEAEGTLIGGNLSVLYSLQGTNLEIDTNDKILFIEDVNEYLYHVDRMISNFKLSGKLDNLKGLIIGHMNRMKDSPVAFGESAYEILQRAVEEYNYPVIYNFPAGHIKQNMAIILGRKIKMNAGSKTSEIIFR